MNSEYIQRLTLFKGKARDMTPEAIERGWYQAKSREAIVSTEQWQLDITDVEIISKN